MSDHEKVTYSQKQVFRNKKRIKGNRGLKWKPEYIEIVSVEIPKEEIERKHKRLAEMIWSWAQEHQDLIKQIQSEPLQLLDGFKEIYWSRSLSDGIPVVGKKQVPITKCLVELSKAASKKTLGKGDWYFRRKTDLEVLRFSAIQLQESVYYQISDGEQRLSSSDSPKPIKDFSWIVWHPKLHDGWPSVRGTALSVSLVLFCLADSKSPREIREIFGEFPEGCIPEVLCFASQQLREERQYDKESKSISEKNSRSNENHPVLKRK